MSIEEFLSGFEAGKIGLSFNGMERIEEVSAIVDLLDSEGFRGWDNSSIYEYIQSRFIEEQDYGYMSCDNCGKLDVTAFGADNPHSREIVSWSLLVKLLNDDVSVEDFDSILN